MTLNEKEIELAGLDPKKIRSIAMRIERAALEAKEIGVCVFGGSHGGDLRIDMHDGKGHLLLAEMPGGCWDGGDGAACEDEDGLLRGEI